MISRIVLLSILILSSVTAYAQRGLEDIGCKGCKVLVDGEFIEAPVDKGPVYIDGGARGYLECLYGTIRYPAEAKVKGTQGSVILEHTITEQGYVEDIVIIKDIGDGCGAEALRVFEHCTEGSVFEPAEKDGVKCTVRTTLPVQFKLR